MSITAIISAYALDFINKRTALEKLTGIIKTLEVLEKCDPKICHKVAPGCGLYLYKVNYKDE